MCVFPSKYVRTDLGSCCGGAPDTLYLLPVHAVMTSLPRHRRRMFRFFSASFCRCRILPRETLCNDVMWMDGTLCSACVVRGALAATAKTATVLPQRRRSSVCPSSVGGQQTDGRCALCERETKARNTALGNHIFPINGNLFELTYTLLHIPLLGIHALNEYFPKA